MQHEAERRISAASAVMQALYQTVVLKKELSQKPKLLIYQLIYNLTLPMVTSFGYLLKE